jgi:thymidylate synthase ThyX
MKVTALSLTAPIGLSNPQLTPELLASVLAQYSRSNEGIESILKRVDLAKPDESINRILKFVDYGHASIGGMAAGLAVTIDGLSMYAAYRMFELSPMSDGQESSTRYITLDKSGLPDWVGLGFTGNEAAILQKWAETGLQMYERAYAALDAQVLATPDIVKVPDKLKDKPKAVARIRKNYALDRTRYFLPFAMKTNMALVQSARMWTETITGLLSSGVPELVALGGLLIEALTPYAPNLMKHARAKKGWAQCAANESGGLNAWSHKELFLSVNDLTSNAHVSLFTDRGDDEIAQAISGRENRYDRCGIAARDTSIRCEWTGMAIAELRDLNRHRTGTKSARLLHGGFYIPYETRQVFAQDESMAAWAFATNEALLIADNRPDLAPYALSLGSQVTFRHTTQLDKYVYTAELRTGAGAHFRYAKHYADSVQGIADAGYPMAASAIQIGEAEPE